MNIKLNIISWQKLNLNLTYQQKYVLYVTALLAGEKNGQTVGMKSNIVPKDVGDISQKLTNKPTHNSLISSSLIIKKNAAKTYYSRWCW